MGAYTAMKTDPAKPNFLELTATSKLAALELKRRGCEIQSISIINDVLITISRPKPFAKLVGEQVQIRGGEIIHRIREATIFGARVRWSC